MKFINKFVPAFALVLVLVLAPFVSAQTITTRATPPGVDLVTYPVFPDHAMTSAEMAAMKLHPVLLTEDVVVYNFSHRVKGFIVDTLRKGEVAVADEKGALVYKASCTNRIAVIPPAPKAAVIPAESGSSTAVAPVDSTSPSSDKEKKESEWGSEFLDGLWALIKSLLFLIALILLLWLLAAILRGLYNWIDSFGAEGGSNHHPSPAVVPNPTPTPSTGQTTAPVAVAPTPRPTMVAPATAPTVVPVPRHPASTVSIRRWGPFQSISVSDRQANGYHVTGDGQTLGTFANPGRTEDAGAFGHYFVMQETN